MNSSSPLPPLELLHQRHLLPHVHVLVEGLVHHVHSPEFLRTHPLVLHLLPHALQDRPLQLFVFLHPIRNRLIVFSVSSSFFFLLLCLSLRLADCPALLNMMLHWFLSRICRRFLGVNFGLLFSVRRNMLSLVSRNRLLFDRSGFMLPCVGCDGLFPGVGGGWGLAVLEDLLPGLGFDFLVAFDVSDGLGVNLMLRNGVGELGVLGTDFVGLFAIRGLVVLFFDRLVLVFVLILEFPLALRLPGFFFGAVLVLPPVVDLGPDFLLFLLPSVVLPLFFDVLLIGFRGNGFFNDALARCQVDEEVLVGDWLSALLAFLGPRLASFEVR